MIRKVEAYRDAEGRVHGNRRQAISSDLTRLLKADKASNELVNRLSQDKELRAKVIDLLKEYDGQHYPYGTDDLESETLP